MAMGRDLAEGCDPHRSPNWHGNPPTGWDYARGRRAFNAQSVAAVATQSYARQCCAGFVVRTKPVA